MHFSQIDLKSAPKGSVLSCFYLFTNTNTGINFCSKCGKCRILNKLTGIIVLPLRFSLPRPYWPCAIYQANGKNPHEAKRAQ